MKKDALFRGEFEVGDPHQHHHLHHHCLLVIFIIVSIIIFITIIINYRLSCNTNQHDIIKYLLNIAMPPTNDHHQHHHDNKDDDHQRRSQLPRSLWVMDCLRLVLSDSDAEALDMVQHDLEQCIA